MREKYPDTSIHYLVGPSNYQTVNVVLLPLVLLIKRLQGYGIFHLHWTYLFRIPRLNRSASRFLMQYFSIATIVWIKLLGSKFVWTAHDHLPHAENFRNARSVNKWIRSPALLVILHSAETIVQMQEIDLSPAGRSSSRSGPAGTSIRATSAPRRPVHWASATAARFFSSSRHPSVQVRRPIDRHLFGPGPAEHPTADRRAMPGRIAQGNAVQCRPAWPNLRARGIRPQ